MTEKEETEEMEGTIEMEGIIEGMSKEEESDLVQDKIEMEEIEIEEIEEKEDKEEIMEEEVVNKVDMTIDVMIEAVTGIVVTPTITIAPIDVL